VLAGQRPRRVTRDSRGIDRRTQRAQDVMDCSRTLDDSNVQQS
jgi:hypothetical protein